MGQELQKFTMEKLRAAYKGLGAQGQARAPATLSVEGFGARAGAEGACRNCKGDVWGGGWGGEVFRDWRGSIWFFFFGASVERGWGDIGGRDCSYLEGRWSVCFLARGYLGYCFGLPSFQ